MTSIESLIKDIKAKIKDYKKCGCSSTSVPAGTPREVLKHFHDKGYRIFAEDSFDGSCSISIIWDDEYTPSNLWAKELFIDE